MYKEDSYVNSDAQKMRWLCTIIVLFTEWGYCHCKRWCSSISGILTFQLSCIPLYNLECMYWKEIAAWIIIPNRIRRGSILSVSPSGHTGKKLTPTISLMISVSFWQDRSYYYIYPHTQTLEFILSLQQCLIITRVVNDSCITAGLQLFCVS